MKTTFFLSGQACTLVNWLELIFRRRRSLSISSISREQLVPWSFSSLISKVFVLFLLEVLREAMDDQDLVFPAAALEPGGCSPRGGGIHSQSFSPVSSETYYL